jgi:hypothetical protein
MKVLCNKRQLQRVASVRRGTKAIGLPGRAEFEGSPFNYVG